MEQEESGFSLPQPVNPGFHVQPQVLQSQVHKVSQQHHGNAQANRDDEMLKVLQNPNAITELMVKQQRQSQLPTKDIPVFKGDALQYKSFIRTFEHSIEQKTDNEKDKLYFLEQFTAEEPQELVRSCAHMSASKGYSKAKKLL